MKIFVCVKQVPDTETKIKINSDKMGIDTSGIKWVINPYDEIAIEEAIRLREANPGSQAVAVTVGPKHRVGECLRSALAMGVDEGIVINSTENLDAFSTARALAEVIKQESDVKVVFTGKLAIDDNASSVSQMVAEFLGTSYATVVSKFSFGPENISVDRDIDGGAKEIIQLKIPSVIAANKGLNNPRYASLPNIMKAKKKTLKEIEFSTLGISADSIKVKMGDFTLPPEKPPVKMIGGDAKAQTANLVNLLRDEAKVL